ncbi:MAG: hypothetical protein K2X81_25370 [Candidatus Obscuribacterales bacterium]|nr:hypothetical protein [Candidatus Obscuribacterales bacterium]
MLKGRIKRKRNGYSMAELPLALWVTFMFLFFPLVCLATCTLRFAFLMTAAHEAAYQAALSKTYSTDVSASDQCAINSATSTANNVAANFTGITVQSVKTVIVQSDSQSNNVKTFTSKLANPADTSRYVYMLQTTVVGSILPLIGGQSKALLGNVPGLTAPMVVQATSRKVAENPQGLNL